MKTNKCFETFPKRNEVKEFLKELKSYMYPNYFEDAGDDISSFKKKRICHGPDFFVMAGCRNNQFCSSRI